ncbi:MAG TPA: hypothetical protein VEH84_03980 [Alphaproteobacteria bacterium]|nr:hypothetical protein [Alphaproteobacteria bacterium]
MTDGRTPVLLLTGLPDSGQDALAARLPEGAAALRHAPAPHDHHHGPAGDGCPACQSAGPLAHALRSLALERVRAARPLPLVLLALDDGAPAESAARTLSDDPFLAARYRPAATLCLLDAEAAHDQLDSDLRLPALVRRADRLVLRGAAQLDAEWLRYLRNRLLALNPAAAILDEAEALAV